MDRKDRKNENFDRTENAGSILAENRFSEDRMNEIRRNLMMDYVGKLHIPPEIIPDGMEYAWIRMSVRGVPDPDRLPEMERRGWTPVPSSRHPDMTVRDYLGLNKQLEGFIYREGLMLCERPAEFSELERRALDERNAAAQNYLPGVEGLGDPSMPARVTANRTGRSFGTGTGMPNFQSDY